MSLEKSLDYPYFNFSSTYRVLTSKNYKKLAVEDYIFPALMLVAVVVIPLLLFGLKRGQASTVTTTNVYNLKADVQSLEESFKNSQEETKHRLDRIGEALNAIGGDIKVHTSQLSTMQIDIGKIFDRLREAENNIIRNERRIRNGG